MSCVMFNSAAKLIPPYSLNTAGGNGLASKNKRETSDDFRSESTDD